MIKQNVAEVSTDKIVLFHHPPPKAPLIYALVITEDNTFYSLPTRRVEQNLQIKDLPIVENIPEVILTEFEGVSISVHYLPEKYKKEPQLNSWFIRYFTEQYAHLNDNYNNVYLILATSKNKDVKTLELEKPFNSSSFKKLIKFGITRVVSLTNSSFSPRKENQVLDICREGYRDSLTGLPVYVRKKIFSLSPSILTNAGYKIVKK